MSDTCWPNLMSISLLSFGHIHTYRLRKIVYSNEKKMMPYKWNRRKKHPKSTDDILYCLLFCGGIRAHLPYVCTFFDRKKRKFSKQNKILLLLLLQICGMICKFFFQLFSTDEYIESLKENADKSKVSFFKQFHILFCNNSSICF